MKENVSVIVIENVIVIETVMKEIESEIGRETVIASVSGREKIGRT